MKNHSVNKSQSGLFSYLLILMGFFLLFEVSFFTQRCGFYLADFRMVSLHLVIPKTVLPGLAFFLFAQTLVHLSFVVSIWIMARLIGVAVHCDFKKTQTIGFSLFILGIITILLANQYFIPNSGFSDFMRTMVPARALLPLLILFSLIFLTALAVALTGLLLLLVRKLPRISRMIVGVIFLTSTAGTMIHHQHLVVDAATQDRPNIIVIGVDSLRPDFLGFMGGDKITPNIDDFLKHATVFTQAVTPQARTYPSLMSVLSGQYPKTIGARYDLIARSLVHWEDTLPQVLHAHGYETLFATDDTRFSVIDTSYGFDHIIAPPVGFNNFVLGTMNDLPFSNLLINTALGKWLFPYNYSNRAAFATYNPDSFLKLMAPSLEQSRQQPLFMLVHFCLPHFPYFWQNYSFNNTVKAVPHYYYAVQRADRQIADFLAMLEQDGLLKHSIVVLLSDHGEALELHGDRITDRDMFIAGSDNPKKIIPHFYPTSFTFETVNQSAGHGTDVLSMTQYHTVLAFRLYGLTEVTPQVVSRTVSLMDIKPTLFSLLGIKPVHTDGNSLTPFILAAGDTVKDEPQDLFLESDFSPQSVRAVHPEARKVLFEGIDFFEIDPVTTQLSTKQSMGELIISSKQYANLSGEWILALYPQPAKVMMPILVNLKTGQWTNDLRTPFALNSPARRMLAALQKFYGNELSLIQNVSADVS